MKKYMYYLPVILVNYIIKKDKLQLKLTQQPTNANRHKI